MNDKEIEKDWRDIGDELFSFGEFNSCNILSHYSQNLFD